MRDLQGLLAYFAKPHKEYTFLAEITNALETIRVHNGIGILVVDGNQYTGLGHLGSIETITEDCEVTDKGYRLTLSGVSGEVATLAVGSPHDWYGAKVVMRLAMIDDTGVVVADPMTVMPGTISAPDVTYAKESSSVSLETRHLWAKWARVNPGKMSNERLQERSPGNLFLQFIGSGLGQRTLTWDGFVLRTGGDPRFTPREPNR